MEGIDKYEYLKSKEARNRWIRDMLYQILIDWNTIEDKNSIFFRNSRVNQPDGIFQLEFGKITERTHDRWYETNKRSGFNYANRKKTKILNILFSYYY